jgi:hypothetical protein
MAAPELTDDDCDATLEQAQHVAQQAFQWGLSHFPADTDAAVALAMSMLVQATGHAAAQATGVTTDESRIKRAAALASEQVAEATVSQHGVLMRARAAAQGAG